MSNPNQQIKKIAVFTSGGDAPGMNACIRAVVRSSVYFGMEVFGIHGGYQGMIENDIHPMDASSVANIIQYGGTILKTARSKEFMTPEGRKKAFNNLKSHGIDAIVAIGGNGTYTGALKFNEEYQIPVVGCPGTIDNDLFGTDFTIGFDTAINTAMDAVDKIRDTADAHDRVFFIEVMGRHSGHIALYAGIGGGAEGIFIPEKDNEFEEIGIAGHPEGSPDIDQNTVNEFLNKKYELSKDKDLNLELVTQFFFNAEPFIKWCKFLDNSNIKLPVRVGFPGPASFKTLLNFGIMSGVGNSLSFLKKNSSKVTDLLTKTSNDEMFIELANFSKEQSSFKNFHCFPFGGFEKTCHWLNALQNGDFTMENDKIVLHNKIF